MTAARKPVAPLTANIGGSTASPQEALATLASAAFFHKTADASARAHLARFNLISSRFDALRSAYYLTCSNDDSLRHESDQLTDLSRYPLQVVADCLDHGADMPSGFEIVSRTEISPPGPVFKFVENGVAHKARQPAEEQVVVRVMGVKYGFIREVV